MPFRWMFALDDFERSCDRAGMDDTERMAYLRVLHEMYVEGGQLSEENLPRLCKLSRHKFKNFLPKLFKLLHRDVGTVFHPRVDRELKKMGEIRDKRKAAANRRWAKKKKKPPEKPMQVHDDDLCKRNASAMQVQCNTATAIPITENSSSATDRSKKKSQPRSGRLRRSGAIGAPDYSTQEQRDAYAHQKMAEVIGGDHAWEIIQAAEDINHKDHDDAVSICIKAAKTAQVGWVSPERRSGKRTQDEGRKGKG